MIRARRTAILAGILALGALTSAHAQGPSDAAKPYVSIEALRAKYADKAGHIARIGGVDVYYKDEGSGPVLLMIHGSVSNLATYDGVVAKLKSRYRIIRFDIPPGGLSGPVSDEAAATLKPADIAEGLLNRLGVTSATVVGVSSGGTLGVFLAAKRPDMVERLILSNMPSDPVTTGHMTPSPELAKEQDEAKRTGFQTQAFWNAFLRYFAGDPARMTLAIRERYYDMNRRAPEKNSLALVAQVADHAKAVEAFGNVTCPTLLIWGGADHLLTPPSAGVLAAYLTHAQVSTIFLPDVGHYPPLEAPERFAQIVAAYVEAATPGAGRSNRTSTLPKAP